jgi:hypothetical protein
MNVNWRNLIGLTGLLALLVYFGPVMQYIRSSRPFICLETLPPGQRNLVVLGIIIVSILIVREIRKGR